MSKDKSMQEGSRERDTLSREMSAQGAKYNPNVSDALLGQ